MYKFLSKLIIFSIIFYMCSNSSVLADVLSFQIKVPDSNTIVNTEINERDIRTFKLSKDEVMGPILSLTFTRAGAKKLKAATAQNIGSQLVILYEDNVLISPIIREEIKDGKVEITSGSNDKVEEYQKIKNSLLFAGVKENKHFLNTTNVPIIMLTVLGLIITIIICIKLKCNNEFENLDTKTCPYCGEKIKVTAVKCWHCGKFIKGE